MSTQEFYNTIERDLSIREVPGLTMCRVEYGEGGMLSDQREYLHFSRERLTFDICAAPFGTSFFFSCRFSEYTPKVKLWQVFVLLGFFIGAWVVLRDRFGSLDGSSVVVVAFILGFLVMSFGPGSGGLDALLLNSPVLGGIYLHLFRKDTYYRQDTRLMYMDTINMVTKALVEHVSGAKGIQFVCFKERSPILSELYKPTTVTIPKQPTAA